ncbi:MAG: sigma-70 family RNA polymerase sigma factor [Pusillimonas sp.]
MSTAPSPSQEIASFYSNHHGWLRGWLHRKLGNAFDAADLAHDTYVRILAAGNPPEPQYSRRYLAQVANGLVVDLYRRRRIEAAYLQTLSLVPEPEAPSEETRALVLEALIEIDTILEQLPDKARRALLLCKLDGLSYREIAAQLNVSVSSVEKYIARGLQACYLALYDHG